MNRGTSTQTLQQRRQALLRRSAELRLQLTLDAQGLKPPLALVDQVIHAGRWLARHPQWPLALAAVLLMRRPRRVLAASGGVALRVWRGWRWWRHMAPALKPALAALLDSLQRGGRGKPS